jgi:hypothetical protein
LLDFDVVDNAVAPLAQTGALYPAHLFWRWHLAKEDLFFKKQPSK